MASEKVLVNNKFGKYNKNIDAFQKQLKIDINAIKMVTYSFCIYANVECNLVILLGLKLYIYIYL